MKLSTLAILWGLTLSIQAEQTSWLSSLDLTKMRQGWGQPQANRSVTEKPMCIGGVSFTNGVGTHARSVFHVKLDGGSKFFLATVGVDDSARNQPGSVVFKVLGDDRLLWQSEKKKPGEKGQSINVDVQGIHTLTLIAGDAGDSINFDYADWADARFVVTGKLPKTMDIPEEQAIILTPKPPKAPRINGPVVYGCRPGHPFIYRIPTTGLRPMSFSAESLPDGLVLDAERGILTGKAPIKGSHTVILKAKNPYGNHQRNLKIVSGDTLALTPSMGWNHWYAHYDRITDKCMREAADAMVLSGMADVGYQYVSIDDCWMNAAKQQDPMRVGPLRDAQGNLIPNKYFPDMKGLTDYIHAKGLKAGIYTSPGPRTCAGFAGSYQHEEQDARLFAEWGYDFLKYDWCSYDEVVQGNHSLPTLKKPYQLMGDVLKKLDRDMVFNLCQYGMGDVWEWGEAVGGHSWRTAGDLGFELNRVFEVALANAKNRGWSRPGSWNDPDYIQIGYIGKANELGTPKPCGMTPSEQYAFMSLWCLMASPLFYSGDMSRLDAFTINVLCNHEVIAVDQDPLGQCARVIPLGDETFVMVKDMEDGSKAIGLCNRSETKTRLQIKWSDLGITDNQRVRNLWIQKNLGSFNNTFQAWVPRHGVCLVRAWPIKGH